jgi:hypothetical protein
VEGQQKNLWAEVRKETERGTDRLTIPDILADGMCGQSVLDFLSTTDVGRLAPVLSEEGAQSEASEWQLRERREREEERRHEAEELGAGGEEPLFLPTPSFMVSVEKV